MTYPITLNRRRLLQAAGLAALSGGAAWSTSACSTAPEADSGPPGTFRIYWNAGHHYEAYQQVITEFEKKHDVNVTFQRAQWDDLRTRLLADLAAGNPPDLVEEPGGWAQEFAISGDALSLQDYIDKDGPSMGYPTDWQPETVESNSYNGEVYGIQIHYTCNILLFNKQMFDEARVDPPTTWSEFVEVTKKLTTSAVSGVALNQDPGYGWPWMLQNGVRHYDPKTKQFLQPRAKALEALQFQADLIHKHKVSPVPIPSTDPTGPQKLLSAERTAMILTGPWDLEAIKQTSSDLPLGIAPALRKERRSTNSAGAAMFIPAKARTPDRSWDLIKRLTTLDVELAATKESDMLMPRQSWSEREVVQSNEDISAFAKALPYAEDPLRELRLTGKSGEIEDLYKNLYQGVVMQNHDVEEAVDEFVEAAERALQEG